MLTPAAQALPPPSVPPSCSCPVPPPSGREEPPPGDASGEAPAGAAEPPGAPHPAREMHVKDVARMKRGRSIGDLHHGRAPLLYASSRWNLTARTHEVRPGAV